MIGLEELYWFAKLGKPKRKLSVYNLREDLSTYISQPVFFLSTGRCGTRWFSDLLAKKKELALFHSPVPSLAIQSRLAWELTNRYAFNMPGEVHDLLGELFFTGREQHLRYTAKTKKRYIETNNYITFFAPVLSSIFPDAKFVHLVRHPGGFIRSGLDRSYFTSGEADDIKRIQPLSVDTNTYWQGLSPYGKVAWLWNETNQFIDRFRQTLPNDRSMVFPFDLSETGGIQKILDFISVEIPEKRIKSMLSVKKNVQKKRSYPPFDQWKDEHKEEVKAICSKQAELYNFQF